ncbi:MAG: hypothetical protein QOJ16_3482, partial [Acidobacteriota bacterium]|nr:hypothetical protein [Acidobacteriota bacterium]
PEAMALTRKAARADLVALFDRAEEELLGVTENWWRPEAQTVLRGLVERLAKKKG